MVHGDAFQISIKQQHNQMLLTIPSQIFAVSTFNMNVADYWLMAREFSIWNTAIASLQFWTVDLNPFTLSIATEEVYSTFFYSTSTYTLHQQPDKVLFGHFVTTLNAAFEQQLALADKGYESSSDIINLPTPLRKTLRIHHVSIIENTSFNPNPVTP